MLVLQWQAGQATWKSTTRWMLEQQQQQQEEEEEEEEAKGGLSAIGCMGAEMDWMDHGMNRLSVRGGVRPKPLVGWISATHTSSIWLKIIEYLEYQHVCTYKKPPIRPSVQRCHLGLEFI
jgi:hypothetical protein